MYHLFYFMFPSVTTCSLQQQIPLRQQCLQHKRVAQGGYGVERATQWPSQLLTEMRNVQNLPCHTTHSPTSTDSRLGRVQGTLKAKRPSSASGTLFREPTREKMLGVVVLRNHREVKLQQHSRQTGRVRWDARLGWGVGCSGTLCVAYTVHRRRGRQAYPVCCAPDRKSNQARQSCDGQKGGVAQRRLRPDCMHLSCR